MTRPEQRRRLDAGDPQPDRHQHALRERRAEDAVDDARAWSSPRPASMCRPRVGRDAARPRRAARATIASPSRKKKNAISTDSVSCSRPSPQRSRRPSARRPWPVRRIFLSSSSSRRAVVRERGPVVGEPRADQRQLRNPRRRIGRPALDKPAHERRNAIGVLGERRADDDERRDDHHEDEHGDRVAASADRPRAASPMRTPATSSPPGSPPRRWPTGTAQDQEDADDEHREHDQRDRLVDARGASFHGLTLMVAASLAGTAVTRAPQRIESAGSARALCRNPARRQVSASGLSAARRLRTLARSRTRPRSRRRLCNARSGILDSASGIMPSTGRGALFRIR